MFLKTISRSACSKKSHLPKINSMHKYLWTLQWLEIFFFNVLYAKHKCTLFRWVFFRQCCLCILFSSCCLLLRCDNYCVLRLHTCLIFGPILINNFPENVIFTVRMVFFLLPPLGPFSLSGGFEMVPSGQMISSGSSWIGCHFSWAP